MTTTESYGCDKHGEDAYQGCAMCDLETLRERLHEAELVAASWKREAELNEQAADESSGYAKRLAEAEALLRDVREDYARAMNEAQIAADVGCNLTELGVKMSMWINKIARIDAHLAREKNGNE